MMKSQLDCHLQLWEKRKFQSNEALLLFTWNIFCNKLFLEEEEEESVNRTQNPVNIYLYIFKSYLDRPPVLEVKVSISHRFSVSLTPRQHSGTFKWFSLQLGGSNWPHWS